MFGVWVGRLEEEAICFVYVVLQVRFVPSFQVGGYGCGLCPGIFSPFLITCKHQKRLMLEVKNEIIFSKKSKD